MTYHVPREINTDSHEAQGFHKAQLLGRIRQRHPQPLSTIQDVLCNRIYLQLAGAHPGGRPAVATDSRDGWTWGRGPSMRF